ncbi:MAG: GNAT family N-acetyltransferase [Cyanobacteria bacterium NC_groundwater_1444_Ag_S-0.65um_54_12]|nr:GNAT family N-acetyltransferase [Cyanobacteria bacterium NC_groundwater_1444_Ag_S-0.65um_54_12]
MVDTKLVIGEYTPDQSAEALRLERLCVQGKAYRLSFNRSTFHRRAENFASYRIVTARQDQLIGVLGMAQKEMMLCGRPVPAAFLFDLRVHPDFRGRGIARCLAREARNWILPRADLAYTYTMTENSTVSYLGELFGMRVVSDYRYLVMPTYRSKAPQLVASAVTPQEVQEALWRVAGPFDFAALPIVGDDAPTQRRYQTGHVASWILQHGPELAGCSAWDNRGILGEVMAGMPAWLDLAKKLFGTWPFNRRSWPHIPTPGEELHSWYLYDFFATDGEIARQLWLAINAKAQECGIDYCYLVHDAKEPWIRAIRSTVPASFAPLVPYSLLAVPIHCQLPVTFSRLLVDVLDL